MLNNQRYCDKPASIGSSADSLATNSEEAYVSKFQDKFDSLHKISLFERLELYYGNLQQ
jgi:hypothetical protein